MASSAALMARVLGMVSRASNVVANVLADVCSILRICWICFSGSMWLWLWLVLVLLSSFPNPNVFVAKSWPQQTQQWPIAHRSRRCGHGPALFTPVLSEQKLFGIRIWPWISNNFLDSKVEKRQVPAISK